MENQAQISILDFPECVRKRKGMYLPNVNYMVYEIVDNGVDEGSAGYATNIFITAKDKVVSIMDNGRGIPVTPHKDPRYKNLSQAEVAYTVLHAGGKFGDDQGYKGKTGGLNGVGASCVNALSKWLELEVWCNEKIYKCRFEKGIIVEHMKQIGTYSNKEACSGTKVTFELDDTIWIDEIIDFNIIKKRMKQLAYLNPNLSFQLDIDNERYKIKDIFHFEKGLISYIEDLASNRELIIPILKVESTKDDIDVVCAFSYSNKFDETLYSFVNNICTVDGGDHLIGLRNALSKVINKYAFDNKMIKENIKFDISDTLEGIIGIINIRVKDPEFDGQGKSKIRMPKVRTVVRTIIEEYFYEYLDHNPEIAKLLVNRAIDAMKVRINVAKTRETLRKTKTGFEGKAEKFSDCHSNDPEICELWLAEGDSAGGSLKKGRCSKYQAILPIFGKILNSKKAKLNELLKSPKIRDLIKTLGCGFGEDFDISKLKYHKIITASDADRFLSALFRNEYEI